jgi:hypothetical protein
MSEMTDHGITVELREASKWLGDLDASQKAQDLMIAASVEIERLRDELVRIQTERPFICGFNQGWDAAVDSGEGSPKSGPHVDEFDMLIAVLMREAEDSRDVSMTRTASRLSVLFHEKRPTQTEHLMAWEYLETVPAADAPVSDNPSGMYCPSCRRGGLSHCAHPEHCGCMKLMRPTDSTKEGNR